MNETEQALTEAVAKALYEFWCSESRHHMTHEDMTEGWGYHRKWVEDNDWEPTPKVYGMARTSIAAVRQFYEQAMLSDDVVSKLLEAVEDDSVLVMALSALKQRGGNVSIGATRGMGREWLRAALATAGITGAGQEGGSDA